MSGWRGGSRWRGDPKPGGVLELGAQIGRIADAVEVWDPSELLVSAEDTPDGVAVQLGVGAGVATPDPGTALGWSIPLRDIAGRRITQIPDYLIEGYARLLLRVNPASFAAPSNLWMGVGVLSNGPLSTATRGVVWGLQNTVAGEWLAFYTTHSGAAWGAAQAAISGQADPGGLHGVWGGPALSPVQTFGVAALPLKGANFATSSRNFPERNLSGSDPHLCMCVGWALAPVTPDAVTFRAGGRFQQPAPPLDI